MRCDGRNGQEERFLGLDCVIEKAFCFLSYDVRGVPAFITDRRILATLPRAIKVLVCVRVKQKVRSCKPSRIRCIVVLDGMCVEEFPSVVCVESSFLQPDREILLVQSLAHEFRIASCSNQSGTDSGYFHRSLTVRWVHIGDISVVRGLPRPEIDSRWAAKGDSTKVVLVSEAFVDEVFLDKRLVRE